MENENLNKNLKIAVVHDHLGWSGGGERTALIMALGLGADFITAHANPETFSDYQKTLGNKLKILASYVINKEVVRFFWLRNLFWRKRKILANYDILIASGQAATEAVAKYGSLKCIKILYTHTPPRRIYDLYEQSKNNYKKILRPLFFIFARYWKIVYLRALDKINFNIANSQNIAKRLKKYTKREANTIIWPPILIEKFKWIEAGDYFLSWARNDENKRVELIVKAFQKMPKEKLIIASGGDRLEKIKKMAEGYNNIRVLGWVSDEKLFDLVGRCRAAIYIPRDEDAGMTQLEANAAGKPVLGVAEGGLLETIINNQTGILIPTNPNEDDLIKTIKKMTYDWCSARRKICEDHAQKFSQEIFIQKIKKVIKENNPRLPLLGIDASRHEDPRYPGQGQRTGVEEYAKNIILNLVKLSQKRNIRIRLYTPRLIQSLPAKMQKVLPAQKRWTDKTLSQELKYSPPDYFFTPAYYIPKNHPEKSFATIHDVLFCSRPELYSLKEKLKLNFATRNNILRAKKIITISNFSKQEIVRGYKINPEKIQVIPLGYQKINQQNVKNNKQINNNLKKIIYLGRIEKKKSIDILVKAFSIFLAKNNNPKNWELILIGRLGFQNEKIIKLIQDLNLENQIKLTGYLTSEEKNNLLSQAEILVHPSDAEGACLPLFEAWDFRVPAILADIPLMKELAREGALYFKAQDENNLAKKILELSENQELKNQLIKKGEEILAQKSWEKSAEEILNTILN